jgi:hypothetical protein
MIARGLAIAVLTQEPVAAYQGSPFATIQNSPQNTTEAF